MALLSDLTYEWIGKLFNFIEGGAPWPDGIAKGRLAYLSKDPYNPYCSLAYRLLTILPVLYRRWASIRLQDLANWTGNWSHQELCAGVGSNGAEDAWMRLALEDEYNKALSFDYAGGTIDIQKCFDQISRELLAQIATAAGMPQTVLRTYIAYQNALGGT